MLKLEFNIRQDEQGKYWTVNNVEGIPYRHDFQDLNDIAETFWAAGIAHASEGALIVLPRKCEV